MAMAYYDSARILLEERIKLSPNEQKYHSSLGIVYARMGMNKEAVQQGILATQLMPESLDAWAGYDRQVDLARIYAITDDTEQAIAKIDYLLSNPGNFSKMTLEYDPDFDGLRNTQAYKDILQKEF